MRLEHSFVQREDATAHLSHLESGQGLAVDFHPAVKHIDLGEQLALRADGLHCSAEFWLSVIGVCGCACLYQWGGRGNLQDRTVSSCGPLCK